MSKDRMTAANERKRRERELWESLAFSELEMERIKKAAGRIGMKWGGKALEFVLWALKRRHGWDGSTLFPVDDLAAARSGALAEAARIEWEAASVKARNVHDRIAGVLLGEVLADEKLSEMASDVFIHHGSGARELCSSAAFWVGGGCGGIEAKRCLLRRWLAVPDCVLASARREFERVALDRMRSYFLEGRRHHRRKIKPWLLG